VLHVGGHLGPERLNSFASAAKALVGSSHTSIVFDMTKVTYMSSSYIGLVMSSMVEVQKRGGSLVIRVSRQVKRLLQLAGADRFGNIEQADSF
jgi:anti-anti-sigma factor